MKFDALTEWRNFEDALVKELNARSLAEFKSAWASLPAKTEFYRTILLKKVGDRLKYELGCEHLLRDFVLFNKDRVPVVFIESENNHASASHEIEKLCAVSSPVKALFLSCSWS